jgi:hypothetical protein
MPIVGPIKSTTVQLVYDSDSGGFGGPVDMDGPVVGRVGYHQDGADNLDLRIVVDFGQPNSVYQVFLTAGPAHASAHGYRDVGQLVTNALGQGSAAIVVPFGLLEAAPFGAGCRTDHLDLMEAAGDLRKGLVTAGALNYFVCRKRVGSAPTERVELSGHIGTGDPLGERTAPADAGGA